MAGGAGGAAAPNRPRCPSPDAARALAVLAHKRAAVVRLRDERTIDDIVLREVQAQLDAEEVRLSRGAPAAE